MVVYEGSWCDAVDYVLSMSSTGRDVYTEESFASNTFSKRATWSLEADYGRRESTVTTTRPIHPADMISAKWRKAEAAPHELAIHRTQARADD